MVFTVCEHEYMNVAPPPPTIDHPAPLIAVTAYVIVDVLLLSRPFQRQP